ncbi:hypothetical protein ACFSTA_03445 [Ornithinibacillus salinisoli]|uniref:Sporulation histidine kinase inhibitor Sda n=1 Tax=Ornithinibacillus salinisoli TaxID=1848459 RepID=A0ABW4VZM3_9BACI
MISKDELLFFINELQKLIKEHERCEDLKIKQLIQEDILFLSETLHLQSKIDVSIH